MTLPFKLFDSSALQSDGPEVEHGAHFLILHYPLRLRHACATRSAPRRSRSFKRVPRRRVFRPLKMREVTQSKAGGKASSLLGLSFLVGSLACDGVTGGAQVRADALPCGGD